MEVCMLSSRRRTMVWSRSQDTGYMNSNPSPLQRRYFRTCVVEGICHEISRGLRRFCERRS